MIRPHLLLSALLVAVLPFASGAVRAQDDVDEAAVERMGELVSGVLPLGLLLDTIASMDPRWPFQDSPGMVDANQLACVRREMTPAQAERQVQARVRNYARIYGARMQEDMRLLDTDGARLFSKMLMSGLTAEAQGAAAPSEEEFFAQVSPEHFEGMERLLRDPQYGPIRELLGFPPLTAWIDRNEALGHSVGTTFLLPMLSDAFTACDISMSVLGGQSGGNTPSAAKKLEAVQK
ncbi:hypothetical protein [Luteimonas terrae]|uniref:Uncharacterized protein n=1 Tax=Luteimonas terrae TaxID=1530191 RepID=A0ABU1XUM6_9GAMM|nr:hypothetical protein [Luteimonas terrae]MDR7192468.1 hypothetical protein [Luteimonas terrae]